MYMHIFLYIRTCVFVGAQLPSLHVHACHMYVCTCVYTVSSDLSNTCLSGSIICPALCCESPSLNCTQFLLIYPTPGLSDTFMGSRYRCINQIPRYTHNVFLCVLFATCSVQNHAKLASPCIFVCTYVRTYVNVNICTMYVCMCLYWLVLLLPLALSLLVSVCCADPTRTETVEEASRAPHLPHPLHLRYVPPLRVRLNHDLRDAQELSSHAAVRFQTEIVC